MLVPEDSSGFIWDGLREVGKWSILLSPEPPPPFLRLPRVQDLPSPFPSCSPLRPNSDDWTGRKTRSRRLRAWEWRNPFVKDQRKQAKEECCSRRFLPGTWCFNSFFQLICLLLLLLLFHVVCSETRVLG